MKTPRKHLAFCSWLSLALVAVFGVLLARAPRVGGPRGAGIDAQAGDVRAPGIAQSLVEGLEVAGLRVGMALAEASSPAGADATPRAFGAEAWEIVAQLEALADSPSSFHERAIPLLEPLARAAGGSELDPAGRRVSTVLREEVVVDPGRSALVRGAVLLSLCEVLSPAEFWSTFDAWFADASTPLELLRAGALASTHLGTIAPCSRALSLKQLAAFTTSPLIALPRFYEVGIEKLAPARACTAIRAWLVAPDPRKELFRLSSAPPSADHDLAATADYFVAAQILYCIWGHQALTAPTVGLELVQDARRVHTDPAGGSLVFLKVSNFMVRTLAPCDPYLFGELSKFALASDPVLEALDREFEALDGGLGASRLARIESLRYSIAPEDEAALIRILMRIGKDLDQLGLYDSDSAELTLQYLGQFASDVGASGTARACALMVVAKSGNWPELKRASASVLTPNGDDTLTAVALNSLMKEARADDARRSEVLELLRGFEQEGPSPGLRPSVKRYVAELAR
jgi:hypothetical protein